MREELGWSFRGGEAGSDWGSLVFAGVEVLTGRQFRKLVPVIGAKAPTVHIK